MGAAFSPRYVLAVLRPHGVVSLRVQPQSKARVSLKHPPPSSLLGALSYSLAREDGREVVFRDGHVEPRSAEFRDLIEHVAVAVSGEGYSYGSLYKINEYYRGEALQAVTALMNTFLYGEGDCAIKALFVLSGRCDGDCARLVERAAWGISRLGSRESLVSVERVSSGVGRVLAVDEVETEYSFEWREGVSLEGSYDVVFTADWRSVLGNIASAPRIRVVYPRGRVRVRGKGMKVFQFDEGVVVL